MEQEQQDEELSIFDIFVLTDGETHVVIEDCVYIFQGDRSPPPGRRLHSSLRGVGAEVSLRSQRTSASDSRYPAWSEPGVSLPVL